MSYDVSIGDFSGNYTSNVSGLWYDHMPEGLRGLDGKTGRQAVAVIGDAFDRIHRTIIDLRDDGAVGEPRFCAKYDAKNGWGSTIGALVFLAQIMVACQRHPRHKLRVWA